MSDRLRNNYCGTLDELIWFISLIWFVLFIWLV